MSAYRDQLNARFSKVCEICKVCDIVMPINITRHKTKRDWLLYLSDNICWTFRIEFTCIFSVGKLFISCAVPVMMHPFWRNKGQIFQPIAQAWHRNEAQRNMLSDLVLVHTGYIGTGALLVPGFGTQP